MGFLSSTGGGAAGRPGSGAGGRDLVLSEGLLSMRFASCISLYVNISSKQT